MAGASGEASTTPAPPADPPAADPPPAAAAPPATPSAADPPPADPPADPPAGQRHSFTQAQLDDRLTRARAAHVRGIGSDFGVENEEQMRIVLERDRAAQAQVEKDRKESLSREQQLQEQLATSQASQAAAEETAEGAQFQALILNRCNQLGIRNTAYAEHMVLDAAVRSTDEEFDEEAYLQELLKDPAQASALGIVTSESTGVTTVPGNGQDDPPAVDPKGPPAETDVMEMTTEEYRKFRSGLTGGSGRSSTFG